MFHWTFPTYWPAFAPPEPATSHWSHPRGFIAATAVENAVELVVVAPPGSVHGWSPWFAVDPLLVHIGIPAPWADALNQPHGTIEEPRPSPMSSRKYGQFTPFASAWKVTQPFSEDIALAGHHDESLTDIEAKI